MLNMFSESYERRLLQQCSPQPKKQSVLVRPEPMDRFIPCRLENNWQTSFQGEFERCFCYSYLVIMIVLNCIDVPTTIHSSMEDRVHSFHSRYIPLYLKLSP